jgi:uncharacterized membrane protein YoaK (UPF0700 family)
VWLQRRQIGALAAVNNALELGAAGKVATALTLTAIGGFVDAVGYIALFQIFTANMSGNSVHIGITLGDLNFSNLPRPACAIVAFVAGMTLTRIAITIAARKGIQRFATYTLALEALLLALFARTTPAMEMGQVVDLHSALYFSLVALLAFAMGVQTATLTHVGAMTVYTTFVTGTLTKFSESLTRALFWCYDQAAQSRRRMFDIVRLAPKQRDMRETAFLAAVWNCYLVGATLGTFSKGRWELRSLYLPVAVLVVIIVVDQFRPIGVQEEKHQRG